MMVVCLFVAASGSWIKWTCAHQGDLLLWSFPQACYLSNKPISILLSSETDYKFMSKKNSSTQSMSKWVMLYRTPFDKTQFLEISRCWREMRALQAQLDIPATSRSWEKAEEEEEKAGMVSAPPFIQWQQRRMIFLSISFLTAHLPHLGDNSK